MMYDIPQTQQYGEILVMKFGLHHVVQLFVLIRYQYVKLYVYGVL